LENKTFDVIDARCIREYYLNVILPQSFTEIGKFIQAGFFITLTQLNTRIQGALTKATS